MRLPPLLAIACLARIAHAGVYCTEGCESGYGFQECDSDGRAVCVACSQDQISFGGYDTCQTCSGCSPGYGFVGCRTDVLGTPDCTPCNAGFYGTGGHAQCNRCPQGSTSNGFSGALSDCLCPPGSVPSLLDTGTETECLICPPGTAYTSANNTITCTLCPVDYFCPGGNRSAELCSPGFVNPWPGASAPSPCPAGFYCSGGGAQVVCPSGYYCPSGSITPTLCPNGTWDVVPGRGKRSDCNRTCAACPPGSFRSLCVGSSQGICVECVGCPAGQYQAGCSGNTTFDDSACLACPKGFINPKGSRACQPCPARSVPTSNASSCLCEQGNYFDPGKGCLFCPDCPWGSLNVNCTGEFAGVCVPCTPCPKNKVYIGCIRASFTGVCMPCLENKRSAGGYTRNCVDCPLCPRGSYRPGCNDTSGPLPCVPCRACKPGRIFSGCDGSGFDDDGDCTQQCPVGQHNAGGYDNHCSPCPSAQGPATPASNCSCDAGFYGPTGWECTACPVGTFCAGGSTPPRDCQAGTWGNTTGQPNQSTACPFDCFEDSGCLPGTYPTPEECTPAAGPSCAPCPTGTFQNATASGLFCTACPLGLYAHNGSSGVCARCPPDSQTCYGGLACPSGSLSVRNYTKGERATWVVRPSIPPGQLKLAVTSSDAAGRSFRSNSGLDTLSVFTCVEATTACLAWVFTGSLGASGTFRLPPGWLATDTGVFVLKWVSRASGAGLGWEISWVSDVPPCLPCGPGRIMLSTGSTCANCTAGTYSSQDYSSVCTLCAPGSFQTARGATACQACLPGWYQPFRGFTVCFACAPGQYSTSSGAPNGEACSLCTAGTYQPYAGHSACIACTEGQYQPSKGRTGCLECTPCPANSTQLQPCSDTANNAQCLCPNQFYFTPWTCTRCQTCPAGTYLVDCNGTNPGVCQPCRQCPPTSYLPGCGGTSPGTTCTPCGIIQCVLGTYLAGCGNISAGACQPCGLACPPGHYTADCGFQSPGWCAPLS